MRHTGSALAAEASLVARSLVAVEARVGDGGAPGGGKAAAARRRRRGAVGCLIPRCVSGAIHGAATGDSVLRARKICLSSGTLLPIPPLRGSGRP